MGSTEIILLSGLLIFGLAVYFFMTSVFTNNTDEELLSWASGDEPIKSKSKLIEICRPLVHQFTLQHALKIKNEKYRRKVKNKILTSGLGSELNVDEFIGLQILLGIMVPVFMFIFNFALELGYHPLFIVLFGIFGMGYPHLYTGMEKKKREVSVLSDLPFFLDLLALSTEAGGLDFVGAIRKIVEKVDSTTSILGQELSTVLSDITLGSTRAEAMKKMAARLDISEITSFVAVLVDADATGASISQVLKDQSEQMRLDRFVRAEKAGARASQAILLPMMFFIFPAVILTVLGPVILQFWYGGAK